MPLPMPRLDNRTFDQLIAEGLSIIQRHAPAWTDHNIHDPGITLNDLFAWLVEMDSYRLDRTAEASYRAFLRLLGVEAYPVRVAETILAFALEPSGSPVNLPAGIQVSNAAGNIIFQTKDRLYVSQSSLEVILTGPEDDLTDRSTENKTMGKGYSPFGQEPKPGHALYLGFDQAIAELPIEVSLYVWVGPPEIDKEIRERLKAEWELVMKEEVKVCPPGIGPDPPDWRQHYSARTVWEYYTKPGLWTPLSDVVDETRALTLSGFVRFTTPAKDQHIKGGVKSTPYAERYFIRCRLISGSYGCPPEIDMISLNAVPASHAADVEREEKLGVSNGRARQLFTLKHAPIVPWSTTLKALINGKEEGAWKEAPSWDRIGPHDRAYVLSPEAGEIAFGNGRIGRVPPAGAEIFTTYKKGGGPPGNLVAGSLIKVLDNRYPLKVIQPYKAIGGAEAESLADAKGRAVVFLAKPHRAVTLADFEALALETPGVPVARVHAIPDYDPAMPCLPALGSVTLIILPYCPEPRPEPGPDMLREVARYIERRRTLTTELHVIGPSYTTVIVSARLHTEPDMDKANIISQARDALNRFFHPFHGGPDSKGWPIGRDVYRAEVMAMLNALPHILYVDEVRLITDEGLEAHCGNISICPHGLVASGRHKITVIERSRRS